MTTGVNSLPPIPPIDFDAVLQDKDKDWIRFGIPYANTSLYKFLSNVQFAIERQVCEDKSIVQM